MWLTRFSIKNPTIVTIFFLAVGLFDTKFAATDVQQSVAQA